MCVVHQQPAHLVSTRLFEPLLNTSQAQRTGRKSRGVEDWSRYPPAAFNDQARVGYISFMTAVGNALTD